MKELIKEFKERIDLEIEKLELLSDKIDDDMSEQGKEIREKIWKWIELKDSF